MVEFHDGNFTCYVEFDGKAADMSQPVDDAIMQAMGTLQKIFENDV